MSVGSSGEGQLVTWSVSAPHTYFTVALQGEPGENLSRVIFQSAADGMYAVYTNEPYPVRLLNEDGEEAPMILEHAISSCAVKESITWVRVFDGIDIEQTYTVELGPHSSSTASLAFEFVGSREPLYRDADQDGRAVAARGASAWCEPPPGYSLQPGQDCDDEDALAFPGAPELCDGKDSDCDGRDDADEANLCRDSRVGGVCDTFGAESRCGCRSEDDCPSGTVCEPSGRCEAETSGTGGQGGAPSVGPDPGGDSGEAGSNPGSGEPGQGGAGPERPDTDPGSGGRSGSPKPSGPGDEATSGGGCSCSLPSLTPPAPGGALLVALGLLFRRRARKS